MHSMRWAMILCYTKASNQTTQIPCILASHRIAPLSPFKQCFIYALGKCCKAFSIHILFTSSCRFVRVIFCCWCCNQKRLISIRGVIAHAKSEWPIGKQNAAFSHPVDGYTRVTSACNAVVLALEGKKCNRKRITFTTSQLAVPLKFLSVGNI